MHIIGWRGGTIRTQNQVPRILWRISTRPGVWLLIHTEGRPDPSRAWPDPGFLPTGAIAGWYLRFGGLRGWYEPGSLLAGRARRALSDAPTAPEAATRVSLGTFRPCGKPTQA